MQVEDFTQLKEMMLTSSFKLELLEMKWMSKKNLKTICGVQKSS